MLYILYVVASLNLCKRYAATKMKATFKDNAVAHECFLLLSKVMKPVSEVCNKVDVNRFFFPESQLFIVQPSNRQ